MAYDFGEPDPTILLQNALAWVRRSKRLVAMAEPPWS